ncbi:MAG: alpha/beta fold hydrolase, partial [Leptolyngbya sp. SIO1D8]|nr:alpha/beta fold hydrolase [Leptolyngbya sp. SIO1D8]
MSLVNTPCLTSPKIRVWYWRGWKIRYWVFPAAHPNSPPKPPLLLVHGFAASLNQWRSNWVALAQHQTVYALDLLGFGASQKAATIFNADLWSHQIY